MSRRVETVRLSTGIHRRSMVRRTADEARGTLMGFHGYGETAETEMSELERIPDVDA